MKINKGGSKKSSGDKIRIPNGTYPARLVRIVALGEQPAFDWNPDAREMSARYDENGDRVYLPMINFTFAFPTKMMEYNGEQAPMVLSKEAMVSYGDKALLKKLVDIINPEAEEYNDLLDGIVLVTVGSTTGDNAKITDVTPPIEGLNVDEVEMAKYVFDFDNPDPTIFSSFPDWQKKKIRGGLGWDETKVMVSNM